MAARLPIVLVGGILTQLPSGDTLAAQANDTNLFNMTNGDTVALIPGQAVCFKAAGTIQRALASALATSRIYGLNKAALALAATGYIQTDGVLTLTSAQWDAVTGQSGGLTPGATYFVDPATAGGLTAVIPTTIGQFLVAVGIALSATDMDLDIAKPIGL